MMSPDLKWKQRAEVWLGTTALSTVAMSLTHSTLRMWECKSVCECDCVCVWAVSVWSKRVVFKTHAVLVLSLRTKCKLLWVPHPRLPSLTVSSPFPESTGWVPLPWASPSTEFSPFLASTEDLAVLVILRLGMPTKEKTQIYLFPF